jgi:repressor LexA
MTNNLSTKDKKVYSFIRKQIISYGKAPTLRRIGKEIGVENSPRSVSIVIDRLIKAKLLLKNGREIKLADTHQDTFSEQTIDIPLLGLVPCGSPLFAEDNIEAYIPVSTKIAQPQNKYFFLRAEGDSMNKSGINSGDLLLIKKQDFAENTQRVVALINDEATVKIFEKSGNKVILKPNSTDKEHKPIILTENLIIQGIVQEVLPADLYK